MTESALPGIIVALWAMFGLAFGSFATVVVTRLPAGDTLGGRSRCPHCGRTLRAWELVPVLSRLWLRGSCGGCGARIPVLYAFLEVASALLFALAALSVPGAPAVAALLALTLWILLLIAVIDLRTTMIPDVLTIAFAVSGLLLALALHRASIAGPILGTAVFALQWRVSRGRWVGSGDVLLGGAIGMALGSWIDTLLALGLAYIIGAAVVSVALVLRVRVGRAVPFGPFLAAATMILLLWAPQLRAALML